MRCSLLLTELKFDIDYERGNINFQADALSCLKSLGYERKSLDENIPTYHGNATLAQEQVALVSRLDVLV